MAWMEVLAPAKLNLFLELIGRREDGFHELETIMTSVNLFDRILLRRRSDDRISLTQVPLPRSNHPDVFSMPLNRTNLVWKAIELLRESSGQRFGLDVSVQKRIPNQAGMGGGSSDAASTLIAVNRLFSLGHSIPRLTELANRLGSDIAFFVQARFARCLGRGEIVQPLADTVPLHFVVAMPPAGLSTARVFDQCHVVDTPASSQPLTKAMQRGDVRQIGRTMCNRLQPAATELCPWIDRLSIAFAGSGCDAHQMTGSGTGYFGLFRSRSVADRQARRLAARLPSCSLFSVSTIGKQANLIRYRTG